MRKRRDASLPGGEDVELPIPTKFFIICKNSLYIENVEDLEVLGKKQGLDFTYEIEDQTASAVWQRADCLLLLKNNKGQSSCRTHENFWLHVVLSTLKNLITYK
ncbi:hypothetical protein STEG23_002896, partial [Scotinomys teguina]